MMSEFPEDPEPMPPGVDPVGPPPPPPEFIMPIDANIPKEWIVEDNDGWLDIIVPSWGTGPKRTYRVRMIKETRQLYCECPGFIYHGHCHHIPYLQHFVAKPIKRRGVQDTSIVSYITLMAEGKIGADQELVLRFMADHQLLTDREIARDMGFDDPNKIRPRRNELVRIGVVVANGKRKCTVSGKLAYVWLVPGGVLEEMGQI
jgi:hypothetical protein